MIILYKLVDVFKVIRIKPVVALYAEVSFNICSKELHFVYICLGDCVIMTQCRIRFILRQDSLWSVSELTELQNFSQLAGVSVLMSSVICFCK